MEQISGSDLLGIRSHAAMADDYTTICRNNTDRLTQAYLALQVENVRLREVLKEAVGGIVFLSEEAGLHQDEWRAWNRKAREALGEVGVGNTATTPNTEGQRP